MTQVTYLDGMIGGRGNEDLRDKGVISKRERIAGTVAQRDKRAWCILEQIEDCHWVRGMGPACCGKKFECLCRGWVFYVSATSSLLWYFETETYLCRILNLGIT